MAPRACPCGCGRVPRGVVQTGAAKGAAFAIQMDRECADLGMELARRNEPALNPWLARWATLITRAESLSGQFLAHTHGTATRSTTPDLLALRRALDQLDGEMTEMLKELGVE